MSGSITIQLPERRRQIFQQLDEKPKLVAVPLPSNALQGLKGIISVGGDALVESEQIYDE